VKLFLARELLDGTPRKAMTPARRKRILEANDNVCALDGCDISHGLEIDHIIPLALGGADDDCQMVPLCREHHKEKTRRDIWQIAKAKRQRALVEEIQPSKRPLKSKPSWPPPGSRKLVSRPFPSRKPA
jgi:5-methylcytosine-specific restriction endonuclease McrA